MKSQSLKFKIIIFAIFSVIAAVLVVNSSNNTNNNNSNSNVSITNNKSEVKISKNEEIKKPQPLNKKQEHLEKQWKIGYDQFFEKKYEKAIETERQVIKEDPNFYKAYAVEGIALAYNGNFQKGMQQIDKSLKLNPNYGYARFNKALANELYRHYDEAIEWYKKALEVEKFEWSYYGIASVYGRKSDVENTVKYLKLAIDINPNIKNEAKNEEDFDNVRERKEFKELIQK
jgi:tetratricopeptide (TPR) repeat protein